MDAPLIISQVSTGDSVVVSGEGIAARFWGKDLAPCGAHIALWFALPIAMRLGRGLHIDGAVCPQALQNAQRLVAIWSDLKPDLYLPITVSAAQDLVKVPTRSQSPRLMAFSGGVDSTVALRALHKATAERPDLLTIQGMDYRIGDDARFARLLDRIAPVRRASGGAQRVLCTDAATTYRVFDIPITLGFGFILGACLFAFEGTHSGGIIAADIAQYRECVDGVYGTSTAVTPLMTSSGFGCTLIGAEHARIDKVALLSVDPLALSTVSCCKDYTTRPDNCGVCAKCVRTKGHFLAKTGSIPDIFLKKGLCTKDFDAIDLRSSFYSETWERMINLAEANGNAAPLAPIKQRLAQGKHPGRLRWFVYRLKVVSRARAARRAHEQAQRAKQSF